MVSNRLEVAEQGMNRELADVAVEVAAGFDVVDAMVGYLTGIDQFGGKCIDEEGRGCLTEGPLCCLSVDIASLEKQERPWTRIKVSLTGYLS